MKRGEEREEERWTHSWDSKFGALCSLCVWSVPAQYKHQITRTKKGWVDGSRDWVVKKKTRWTTRAIIPSAQAKSTQTFQFYDWFRPHLKFRTQLCCDAAAGTIQRLCKKRCWPRLVLGCVCDQFVSPAPELDLRLVWNDCLLLAHTYELKDNRNDSHKKRNVMNKNMEHTMKSWKSNESSGAKTEWVGINAAIKGLE